MRPRPVARWLYSHQTFLDGAIEDEIEGKKREKHTIKGN
jgi:hypothetical protein